MLGNKGAGKTHLLHSIKHGAGGAWQLLVTPGVYQKDTDFLEYLLFQIIDTLLGGGKQKGVRPLEYRRRTAGAPAARRRPAAICRPRSKLEPVPAAGPGPLGARASASAARRPRNARNGSSTTSPATRTSRAAGAACSQALAEAGLTPQKACELVCNHIEPAAKPTTPPA